MFQFNLVLSSSGLPVGDPPPPPQIMLQGGAIFMASVVGSNLPSVIHIIGCRIVENDAEDVSCLSCMSSNDSFVGPYFTLLAFHLAVWRCSFSGQECEPRSHSSVAVRIKPRQGARKYALSAAAGGAHPHLPLVRSCRCLAERFYWTKMAASTYWSRSSKEIVHSFLVTMNLGS